MVDNLFYRPADNFKRLLSIFIDLVVVLFLTLLYLSILTFTMGDTDSVVLITYIPTLIFTSYYILPVLISGQTLGKKILRLQIISVKSSKITFDQLIKRLFLSFSFWPGILYIFFNKEHFAIHDKISQTRVIDITSQPMDIGNKE